MKFMMKNFIFTFMKLENGLDKIFDKVNPCVIKQTRNAIQPRINDHVSVKLFYESRICIFFHRHNRYPTHIHKEFFNMKCRCLTRKVWIMNCAHKINIVWANKYICKLATYFKFIDNTQTPLNKWKSIESNRFSKNIDQLVCACINSNEISSFCAWSLRMWCLISMCLVLECKIRFFVIYDTVLSHIRVIRSNIKW